MIENTDYTTWNNTLGPVFMRNQVMFVMQHIDEDTVQFKCGTGDKEVDEHLDKVFTELAQYLQSRNRNS